MDDKKENRPHWAIIGILLFAGALLFYGGSLIAWPSIAENEKIALTQEQKNVRIAEEAKKYTVQVFAAKSERPFEPGLMYKFPMRMLKLENENGPYYISSGSGFLISEDGYILTAYHVAGDADAGKITVVRDGLYYAAQLAAVDKENDLAILKINVEKFPFAKIAKKEPKAGQFAMAAGFPLVYGFTFSLGIVNSPDAKIELYPGVRTIQNDAAINPGNSGGPLVNSDGKIIGVVVAYIPLARYGFAMPITEEKVEKMLGKKIFNEK